MANFAVVLLDDVVAALNWVSISFLTLSVFCGEIKVDRNRFSASGRLF